MYACVAPDLAGMRAGAYLSDCKVTLPSALARSQSNWVSLPRDKGLVCGVPWVGGVICGQELGFGLVFSVVLACLVCVRVHVCTSECMASVAAMMCVPRACYVYKRTRARMTACVLLYPQEGLWEATEQQIAKVLPKADAASV